MTEQPIFTQDRYNDLVDTLDNAMLAMIELGKSEDDAQEALRGFVLNHYFPVWRKLVTAKRDNSSLRSPDDDR